MSEASRQRPSGPSSAFRAFADPLRLRLLRLLLENGELCVCDLCAALGESQPGVSRQLGVLREAGLVDARREGKWRFYAIARDGDRLQRRLLRCVAQCLDDVDDFAADRARLEALEIRQRCA